MSILMSYFVMLKNVEVFGDRIRSNYFEIILKRISSS